MKKHSPFMQPFDRLPATLPIFPLNNAMMFPGGNLPLNIFEPRYVNMLQDAMRSDQLIGMIQPRDESEKSTLFDVGCAGRITRYEENHDGRIEIVLTGLCRFKIHEELASTRGYRLVVPDWSAYDCDYNVQEPAPEITATSFKTALKSYFNENNMEADWTMLEKLDVEELANSLFSFLPISAEEKQLLVEIDTFADRLTAFTAVLESSISKGSSTLH